MHVQVRLEVVFIPLGTFGDALLDLGGQSVINKVAILITRLLNRRSP